MLDFNHFRSYGDPGARHRFERFVLAAVAVVHTNIRNIRADPGDGGIDGFVGDDTEIAVWQAKFFPDGIGDSQKDQVRKSYKRAREKAEEDGLRLVAWTLCVPVDLSAAERTWWKEFRKKRGSDGTEINLMELQDWEREMAKPEAANVRAEYFPGLTPVHSTVAPPLVSVPAGALASDLLFLRQLTAAQIVELDAAREQFYNAEALSRDLADKGFERQRGAWSGLGSDLHGIWSDRFNHHCAQQPASTDQLPELHGDVMERIDQAHASAPHEPLPLTLTHRKGALHQVVQAGKAGWTRGYRSLVSGPRSAASSAASAGAPTTKGPADA